MVLYGVVLDCMYLGRGALRGVVGVIGYLYIKVVDIYVFI